jgi:hypothetical protein
MNKTCQNCKNEFVIDSDHVSFCEKIKVPTPTWCPECRMTRRLSFVNAWSIFWRDCAKCGKKTMSSFRPDFQGTVYCQPCWWGDTWDGTEYGMEYDPSKNFLEQWRELQLKTPQCALETTYLSLKNSDYSNAIAFSKNCYLTFWADYCDDTYYSSIIANIKDSSDLLRSVKSELCYDSVGLGNCNKTFYSDSCDDCVDVWFSRNCNGCINCVGCVNLRGQSYMIFNQKYSREEYFDKIKEFRLDTREGIEVVRKASEEFSKQFPYREYNGNAQNLDVSGEYIFNSKNVKNSYMCINGEDCNYSQFITVPTGKDCYDYSGWGNGVSQMYECGNVGENANGCKFSYYCFPDSLNLEYSSWCVGGKNNFGCVNLKRKQYAILNKVYDKESYEKLTAQIREDMKNNPYIDKKGRVYAYGEFFPIEFSHYPYNDANVIKFVPKTKEQAEIEGYRWQERVDNVYTPTIQGLQLPQTLMETQESIVDEIIACATCARSYKVVDGELTILKKLNLPIPDHCPKCRESKRFEKINKPKLRDTSCAKCGIQIKTAHTTDRVVYCVKCYQLEVV